MTMFPIATTNAITETARLRHAISNRYGERVIDAASDTDARAKAVSESEKASMRHDSMHQTRTTADGTPNRLTTSASTT